MPERRDPGRPRQPIDRPDFHFDTGRLDDRHDHDDHYHDDDAGHVDDFDDVHADDGHDDDRHVDDFWDGVHNDAAGTDGLFDRLQSLIQSLEQQLLTRQQRLEQLVDDRLAAVEAEASRVVRELSDHVHELDRRLDDATGDEPPLDPRPTRDPRR